jgi:tetratricopeptide (TPR) repeat protein
MSTRDSAAAVNTMLKTAIDLYADRRFSEAKSGFEGVLSISPTNPLASEYRDKCVANIRSVVSAHKKRATNLAAAGEYERAISELRATLAYENTPAVRNQIARYGRLMAETETPDTLRIQPSEQPQQSPAQPAQKLAGLDKRYGMGIEYFDNGDFTAAIKALSEVWAVDAKFRNVSPLLAKAYLFVGMNYYAEQNYGQAIMMWEKALTVDPKNSKAERYLRKASEEARALGGLSGQ